MSMLRLLKNLIKIARVLSTDDSSDLQFYTVDLFGKQQKVQGFMPYGLFGSPTAKSMGLLLSQQGQESNGICIASDPKNRPLKDTSDGEVGLGNFNTDAYIFFDKDANGKLVIPGNMTSTIGGNEIETIAGSKTTTVTGASTVTSPTIALQTSVAATTVIGVTLSGDIYIKGSNSITITAPAITIGQAGGTVTKLGTWS